MKKVLIILVAAFAIISANAQNYPTETIRGQLVYRYPVQKGEGLYRISINFGVTQEEIIKWNPTIEKTGLRYGQTIYIPVVNKVDSTQYTVHIIQSRETLYSLARQYGTTVEALIEANPVVSKNMPIGAKLLIPQPKTAPVEQQTESTRPNAEETTKTPTQQEQPKEEPLQQEEKPKTAFERLGEQTPVIGKKKDEPAPTLVQPDSANMALAEDSIIPTIDTTIIDTTNVPIRIAFMLPFVADALKREPGIDRFVEFYEGALIAIHEQQAKGQRFEIYTYDTGKTEAKMESILSNAELKNVDFIIGPAFTSQEEIAQQFAKEHKKPIIIPFTANVSGINDNAYIFQFNTPESMENDTINKYAAAQNWHVVKTSPAEVMGDSTIYGKLSKDKENIIDLQTDSWAETEKVLIKLHHLNQRYNVRLLSRYSWKDKLIPVPCIYTSIFSQTNALKEVAYNIAFARYFNHKHAYDAPRYDILGYDITSFMIMYHQNGSLTYEGLHSNMKYVQTNENGGYINRDIEIITK